MIQQKSSGLSSLAILRAQGEWQGTRNICMVYQQTKGKKPLLLAAYKYLAKKIFESKKPEHVGAHMFLIIAWNLISHAVFVIGSNIDSIWFHGNAILFDIGKTKTNQEETQNIDYPWHVYSNNECPNICPALAMARYLIDHPHILAGKCPLFFKDWTVQSLQQHFVRHCF
jgi:hypothetical protein